MSQSGIYQIRCLINGKIYVGSAAVFQTRWNEHRSLLAKDRHHSIALQRAWKKHGAEQFVFEVLEIIPQEKDLLIGEQRWLDLLRPFRGRGYNMALVAGSPMRGRNHTAEAKAAIGAASKGNSHNKGRKLPAEQRAKIAASEKGRKLKPESIKKRTESRAGWRPSAAHMESFLQAARNPTAETRAKMSAAQKGKANSRGYKHTVEARAKISAANKARIGWKHNPETIAKMRATALRLRGRKRST